MAYSAAITFEIRTISGHRQLDIEIVETEAAAASQWSTANGAGNVVTNKVSGAAEDLSVFDAGTITLYGQSIEAGAAATVAGKLGRASGWSDSTAQELARQATAAAFIRDQTKARYRYPPGSAGKNIMYGRSVVDAGSNSTIRTQITIVEGHVT